MARVRSGRNVRELFEVIRTNADRSFGSAALDSVKLKSRLLTPGGPIYRDIGAYRLA